MRGPALPVQGRSTVRRWSGRIDAVAQLTSKLTLGYREATAEVGSPVAAIGQRVRGHDFHRTTTDPQHGSDAAWRYDDGESHGFASGRLATPPTCTPTGPGHPQAAERLIEGLRMSDACGANGAQMSVLIGGRGSVPGIPELLTLLGLRTLREADTIIVPVRD